MSLPTFTGVICVNAVNAVVKGLMLLFNAVSTAAILLVFVAPVSIRKPVVNRGVKMRIALPDGCRGLDDPQTGRIYRPKSLRSGYVEIQDPMFAKAAKRQLGEVGTALFTGADLPTWSCRCGRTNWEKDSVCRRCGKEKPKE